MSLVTSILQKVAPQIGAVVVVEPEYKLVGHITFKNGNKAFFDRSKLNINGYGSAELAKDKAYSNFFLNHFGYRVTEGQTFFNEKICARIANPRNIDDGFSFAKELGFPLIVKPLNLSQGILVAKVHNQTEYYEVAEKILQINSGLIVERFYSGNDYRIVVLDDEIIAAYQRIPLFITGDGKSKILELLQQKQEIFLNNGRKTHINIEDFRIHQKLQKQNLTLNSVIAKDTIVYLLDNANLSSGGEAVDLTESIHLDFQKLAINITKDMALRLAGVDIITSSITEPILDYTIIEVNGSPGLTHYASSGDTQIKRVEDLYLKILKALENERIQHENPVTPKI
ncbi:ATP-grasp enzyme, D-alanine-D-alanine ligase [Cylindrospermum stagnale PCC 7417]|uniref:ATP-grasp enzyme, D-alanine-D-alanine ligase n=1 Tax=Cylindrospermum stagnale PCC 7417 TaxID=56107 RepID=K9WZS0_9NOST|nr:ATP-grasp enzyme, D-alanine-D-alanine ligase [Cylindrospermum stagnale]AFZ25007.1 ATP-grasp enzyme, D-alanine-D-alanine ligase [Cylindrospermum stagnale PCC 7417]